MTMVTTVKDNEKFYSKAQRVRARKAIEVYYSLGMPAKDNFKNMIQMNMIRNIPITMKDIDIAFEIYGNQAPALKSKIVRKKQGIAINDKIQLQKELMTKNKEITLAIDTITVNGCNFLVTVSLHLYYRSAHYIPSKTTEQYMAALQEILQIYNDSGFKISEIR